MTLCECGHVMAIHRGSSTMGKKCDGYGCQCFIKGILDTRTWEEVKNIKPLKKQENLVAPIKCNYCNGFNVTDSVCCTWCGYKLIKTVNQ